jgi:hypothetical protein
LPQKSADIDWNCLKIRDDFLGIAAKMPKRKKTRREPQKLLDKSAAKSASRGRKQGRKRQTDVSPAEVDIGWPLQAAPIWPLEMAEPERAKKGRPTIRDNFLLGAREHWLYFLEESWPEIGCPLMEIRRAGSSTIEALQRIFEPVQSKDHCLHGRAFLRGSPEPGSGKELRANRIRASSLHDEVQRKQAQREELVRSCIDAENALKQVSEQDIDVIQTECNHRRERLLQLEENLRRTASASKELDKKVLDQETYWFCSQLLDFLCGKKKYAVEPLNLANALAGLPNMGWRESFARCFKMPRCSPFAQLPYRVFEVVSHIWRRRPKDSKDSPIELFRIQILELPKKDGIRDVLGRKWRDLRLAIEDCWKEQHSDEFLPCAITSAFMRNNLRSKSSADQILDASEMLFGTEDQF